MNMLKMILSMAIFGSIGLFVREIPLPSVTIAAVRSAIGAVFMGLLMILRRSSINKTAIKKNLLWLILSGAALAVNWILLFESYRYTSITVATLCYYMAPVFVTIFSPLVLKERLSAARVFFTALAVAGAVMITVDSSFRNDLALKGVLLALGAAALYASVIFMNKKMGRLPAQETTFFQLLFAAAVTIPYALFRGIDSITISTDWVVPLLIVGIVHTGLAYLLFFSAAKHLPAQSTALLSYIDPVTAVILSTVLTRQIPEQYTAIGCGMILVSSILGELICNRRRK